MNSLKHLHACDVVCKLWNYLYKNKFLNGSWGSYAYVGKCSGKRERERVTIYVVI